MDKNDDLKKGQNVSALSRRDFLTQSAGVLGAAYAPASAASGASPLMSTSAPRPNIVFLMGDGVRPDEVGGGNKLIQTPNIDRIAREGASFSNSFAINALCAPSRATVLTGLYSCRHGVIDNKHQLVPGIPILSDFLRKAGYEVAFCGKSHQTEALRNYYWDYYYGYRNEQPYYGASIAEGFHGKVGEDKIIEEYADDAITKHAVGWLQERGEKPFCLFLWLKAPHHPYLPPRSLELKLDDGAIVPKPSTFDEDLKGYPGKPRAFADCRLRLNLDEHHVGMMEALVKAHYASTMGLDDNVGRVLRVLEEKGKLDDTAVIFGSDHGYFLGEWHFVDKRLMHEPSIRTPLFIRYPRLAKAGAVSQKMVLNLDLAPTILELAGLEVPESMQGRSLLPLLQGKEPSSEWRKDWFYAYYESPSTTPRNRGVRSDRYKLIEYWEQSPPEYELYDLQQDPDETHNLYGDSAYSSLQQYLLQRLQELRRETGEM